MAMDERLWAAARIGPRTLVLEVGCGRGALSRDKRAEGFEVVGIDKDAWRGPPIVARTERLPFRDRSFDVVLAQETLIYCSRIGVALGEIRRVLKPGGRLCFGEFLAGVHAPLFHAATGGDVAAWRTRLQESGLQLSLLCDLSEAASEFYGALLARAPATELDWRQNLAQRIALLRSGAIRRVIGVAWKRDA